MKSTESKFTSHRFIEKCSSGQALTYRVLKMQDSLFVYIGNSESESFDGEFWRWQSKIMPKITKFDSTGLGAAFLTQHTKEVTGTSILNVENTDSQDLAQKLTARLNKPVFVSCNASLDRIMKPVIEQRLIQEIKEFPEYF